MSDNLVSSYEAGGYSCNLMAAVLAIVVAMFGLAIMFRRIAKAGLGPYNLQGLGLVLLVPTILILR